MGAPREIWELLSKHNSAEDLGIPSTIVVDLLMRQLFQEGEVSIKRFMEVLRISFKVVDGMMLKMQQEHQVEALTDELERQCLEYFRQIEERGGMEAALEQGWIQHEIADSAYRYQREVDAGLRGIVGVNTNVEHASIEIPILEMDPEGETRHLARLSQVRRERDAERVATALATLRAAAATDANLMEPVLDAVRAYATVGEICDVLRDVFGIYREVVVV